MPKQVVARCGVARRSFRAGQEDPAEVVGRPCAHEAGWGTSHRGSGPCKLHGGNLPTVVAKAKHVLADMELRRELKTFGKPLGKANPEEMLLHMVREAAGNVAYLGARVAELSEKQAEDSGRRGSRLAREPGIGLLGPKIGLDRDGGEHVIGEELRGMTSLYGEWSDRLVKYSKVAVDAGIAKQQVDIAKSQGQTIVVVINRVLAQIGLDEAKQLLARQLIAEEFRVLSSATVEDGL